MLLSVEKPETDMRTLHGGYKCACWYEFVRAQWSLVITGWLAGVHVPR